MPVDNATEFRTVALAALLHDIGKFLQRGRALSFPIEGPHPEVSARFVEVFAGTFAQVADVPLLKTLVSHHHRGQDFAGLRADEVVDPRARLLALLVNKADGLSASERGEHTGQWQDFKTTPLASVFPRAFVAGPGPPRLRHHPAPLTQPARHWLEREKLTSEAVAIDYARLLPLSMHRAGRRSSPAKQLP